MEKLGYIQNFEKLGMGLFVHFGLYSIVGKGEWYKHCYNEDMAKYSQLKDKFKVKKTWAKELVATAKKAGAKYITITTRHHDGFSLYDTCGLSDFDAVHSPTGRDLIREFTDECNKAGIVPFFYHTLIDWHNQDYYNDFPKYLAYLRKSVEILCKNYGKIGGLWFDGMWAAEKVGCDWEEDALYATIRKYQPEAMIINNTGLSECGKTGHIEIDSVTFERGKPTFVDCSEKYVAGEMCQVLNDHWGYAKEDLNYKSVGELIGNLVDCRRYNCNFLLNTGLMGNGSVRDIDKAILTLIGDWIKANKGFIYEAHSADVQAENAFCMTDGKYYYAVIGGVGMNADQNVALNEATAKVKILSDKKVKNAVWLDNGKRFKVKKNEFVAQPFMYGISRNYRVVRFELA